MRFELLVMVSAATRRQTRRHPAVRRRSLSIPLSRFDLLELSRLQILMPITYRTAHLLNVSSLQCDEAYLFVAQRDDRDETEGKHCQLLLWTDRDIVA
jgi:hypothetical protein